MSRDRIEIYGKPMIWDKKNGKFPIRFRIPKEFQERVGATQSRSITYMGTRKGAEAEADVFRRELEHEYNSLFTELGAQNPQLQ